MRYAVIACRIFTRELSFFISKSANVCEIYYLEQMLHDTPDILKRRLQEVINQIDEMNLNGKITYDKILLCYGLCSNGVLDITSKTCDIVIPRCNDCTALFLGSEKRYLEYFNKHKGIYWFNPSWIEIGSVPTKEKVLEDFEKYKKEYGEDNAKYLIEVKNSSLKKYDSCIYIHSSLYDKNEYKDLAKKSCEYFNWSYEQVDEDTSYIEDLVNGNWDDERFFINKKNKYVLPSFDKKIFK